MNEENLNSIACKLQSVGLVFEIESQLCLGDSTVSCEVIEIMKNKYNLQNISCTTFEEIEWEYYLFNYDVMSSEEAKEYALYKKA